MFDIVFKKLDVKGFDYSDVFVTGEKCKYLKSDNKQEIKKFSKTKGLLLLETSSYDVRRYVAEKCLVDGIISCEKYGKRDKINYPDSGVDGVLAKEMLKSKTALVINIRDFLDAKEKEVILERMMFNIKLAKKFKTPIIIISGAKKENQIKHSSVLISFGVVLGLERNQAKQALSLVYDKVKNR